MNSSMTFQNFIVSGTIRFGSAAMDRGALIVDITDAQRMLDMENTTGELLGFSKLNGKHTIRMRLRILQVNLYLFLLKIAVPPY